MRVLAFALFGFCIWSCDSEPRRLALKEQNPTSVEFDYTIGEVSRSIRNLGSLDSIGDVYDSSYPYLSIHLDADSIFSIPENKRDFYISQSDYSIATLGYKEAKVYPGYEYMVAYHLHIDSMAPSKTRVTVFAVKPKVIVGKELLPSLPHLVRLAKVVNVKPSSIEEYEFLVAIGQQLGQQMPGIKLPTKD